MPRYHLLLFIAGTRTQNVAEINSLKLIRQKLGNNCEIEIIDIFNQTEIAQREQILATPTLLRNWPEPRIRVVGTLADIDQVIAQIKR